MRAPQVAVCGSQYSGAGVCFGSTYAKIGMIQRLAWPLCKDDTQVHEAFHIFKTTIKKIVPGAVVMLKASWILSYLIFSDL